MAPMPCKLRENENNGAEMNKCKQAEAESVNLFYFHPRNYAL